MGTLTSFLFNLSASFDLSLHISQSRVSSHIDDVESSLSSHITSDQALNMDITTLLGEAHAKEGATTAAPLTKSSAKKYQKNPKVEESTQEIEESEYPQLK
ncbi:hypothetical protein J1N35_029279 [Gossypium stocksii]|uniref:Uncharacterized protein n=1 Tax=Gossypium stocksii TaxID=47602 RepID=A0A9D3UXK0_9ROSI|nr:hypothetical protein J1N35_029279 [Gossypium stocksii]